MFTGIVSHTGEILSATRQGDLRLAVGCPWKDLKIGESVAVNGVCLTVVDISSGSFTATVSAETLARTAAHWAVGEAVNLERALKAGDDVSGHFVTGHVDGVATVAGIEKTGDSHGMCLKAPKSLSKFIAPKGSVTLDGVSLTVNKVEGARFWVNIIPHTWKTTTLGSRKAGDALNLEIDVIARYVERMLENKE